MGLHRAARVGAALLALGLGWGSVACKGLKEKQATRDEATKLLVAQAEELKAGAEDLDPVLRVKVTWNLEGVDVTDRQDKEHPWRGVIRFRIVTRTKDSDGSEAIDQFNRRFEFLWSTVLQRWLVQPATAP